MKVPESVFTWDIDGDLVAVVDLDGGRSVTNDAEAVVAFLVGAGIDFSGKRLAYRDTLGTWDELKVRDNRFAGFGLLDALTLDHAKAIMTKGTGRTYGPDPQP